MSRGARPVRWASTVFFLPNGRGLGQSARRQRRGRRAPAVHQRLSPFAGLGVVVGQLGDVRQAFGPAALAERFRRPPV